MNCERCGLPAWEETHPLSRVVLTVLRSWMVLAELRSSVVLTDPLSRVVLA